MKRLFVTCVAFVIAFVVVTEAQEVPTNFKTGFPIREALKFVADRGHLDGLVFDDGSYFEDLKLNHDVRIEPSDSNMDAATKLLPGTFEAYLDENGALHVRKKGVARSQRRPDPPHPRATIRSDLDDDPAAISEYVHRKMLGNAAYEQAMMSNALSPSFFGNDTDYYPGSVTGVSENWYGIRTYSVWHQNLIRRVNYAWSTGYIKIKGRKKGRDEKFLEHVSVVACLDDTCTSENQINLIDAAEANNKWDEKLSVPINSDNIAMLLFILEDGSSRPRAFSRRLRVEPAAVENRPKSVIVQSETFERARYRYDLRTHLFQEDASGQLIEKR